MNCPSRRLPYPIYRGATVREHSGSPETPSPAPTTTARSPKESNTTKPSSPSPDAAATSSTPCSATAPSTKPQPRSRLDENHRDTPPGPLSHPDQRPTSAARERRTTATETVITIAFTDDTLTIPPPFDRVIRQHLTALLRRRKRPLLRPPHPRCVVNRPGKYAAKQGDDGDPNVQEAVAGALTARLLLSYIRGV